MGQAHYKDETSKQTAENKKKQLNMLNKYNDILLTLKNLLEENILLQGLPVLSF